MAMLTSSTCTTSRPLQVFCRLQPTSEDVSCVRVLSNTAVELPSPNSTNLLEFSFERIFTERDDQRSVFNSVARPLVQNLIDGKNGLLFAYGLPDSGKTYTMTNDESLGISQQCLSSLLTTIFRYQSARGVFKPDGENGFTVRSVTDHSRGKKIRSDEPCTDVRATMETELPSCDQDNAYSVFVTYIEIHDDEVHDLLENNGEENPTFIPVITAAEMSPLKKSRIDYTSYEREVTEVEVKSVEEGIRVLNAGLERQKLACRNGNSHTVFTIRLVQAPWDEECSTVLQYAEAICVSQLSLVDLAGSVIANQIDPKNIEEGNVANLLMWWRNWDNILRENFLSSCGYKIPLMFKNFLGGEGDIRMLICVNPVQGNLEETINVMNFANSCKKMISKLTSPEKFARRTTNLIPGVKRVLKQIVIEPEEQDLSSILRNDKEVPTKICRIRNVRFTEQNGLEYWVVKVNHFGIANSWEPLRNLMDDLDLVKEFEDKTSSTKPGGNFCSIFFKLKKIVPMDVDHDSPSTLYEKMETLISVVAFGLYPVYETDPYFELIRVCAENTQNKNLKVVQIFEVKRDGEDERFAPFKAWDNRKLLWHGTKPMNLDSILSQGLLINPPDTYRRGSSFGRGIYFTDMVSKAFHYCKSGVGFLLLCEVALGNMLIVNSSLQWYGSLPDAYQSLKALGESQPDPTMTIMLNDGAEIQLGCPTDNEGQHVSSLHFNEYVVYNEAQVKLRYLVHLE